MYFIGLMLVCFSLLMAMWTEPKSLGEDLKSILSLLDEENQEAARAITKKYDDGEIFLLFGEGIKILGLAQSGKIDRLGRLLNIPEPKIKDSVLVKDISELPEALKNAKLVSQEGSDEYVMIEPDPKKEPSTVPFEYYCVERSFVAKEQDSVRNKYIYWDFQGSGPKGYSSWKYLANKVERGFGVLGLPKNFPLDGPTINTIIFHPKARKTAFYFFNKLKNNKLSSYEKGLLLGYYEPNVYAFCFGTEAARRAYPDLTFVEEREPPAFFSEPFLPSDREEFDALGEERKEVLFEKIPGASAASLSTP
jgi:hypothetical protein